MHLFAYRGMACRITGMVDCVGSSIDPATYLFTLQPIGGGAEIPCLRAWDFEAADNVIPLRAPASFPSAQKPGDYPTRSPGTPLHG